MLYEQLWRYLWGLTGFLCVVSFGIVACFFRGSVQEGILLVFFIFPLYYIAIGTRNSPREDTEKASMGPYRSVKSHEPSVVVPVLLLVESDSR